ncbi:hypothetical protein PAECIP111802_06768 [Paenibacillus allorhizosphaerae]|uniref:VOC domain-containing protein n=1 Tax=Paenibacillus allorhizosphaerae TaxID=2849866 RepID=A0ABM8VT82_9BACL|nr:hypothetical protein PAECIP111802_06768 [Paenibacillus allorhizosphaerae]
MSQNQAEEVQLEDITGITCIYVPVQNVYESVKWYRKNLGCRQPSSHDPVQPGAGIAILRFPDQHDKLPGAGLRTAVPAMFLIQSELEGGRLGFNNNNGNRVLSAVSLHRASRSCSSGLRRMGFTLQAIFRKVENADLTFSSMIWMGTCGKSGNPDPFNKSKRTKPSTRRVLICIMPSG